jgi:two-component system, chemotaxis family, CheB/CheR fusion protein
MISKRAEMKADQSLRVVLDQLNESVYFVDTRGKILFANRVFVERLGKARSQIEGQSIYDVVPPDVVAQRRNSIEEVVKTAKPMTHEEERFGEVFLNSVSPIIDERGQVESIAFVGTNITAQRRLLESLTTVVERLAAFAQAISHDIRGPLSAALYAAETLKANTASPKSEASAESLDEVIGMLTKSLNKAFSLIDNLLKLAETDNQRIETEEIDVTEIVREILGERQAQIQDAGTHVNVSDDLGTMKANRIHLYELFSNLIGNSLKHNTGPAPSLNIEYLGEGEDGLHVYRVRDNGPGLPAELMDSIFEPFVRGEDGKSGLGLAIVRRIITVYHGHIMAYNDNGAVFEFSLKDI